MGADCILLIASCLTDEDIKSLSDIALSLSMDVLIEVHNLDELERAQKINLPMIGINNRNLHNFEVTLQTTIDLIDKISDDKIIITESGITSKADVEMMHENNVFGFLVGEAFMRHPNPGQQLKEFFK
jgi:indole-3-glycerol phosphate synthase